MPKNKAVNALNSSNWKTCITTSRKPPELVRSFSNSLQSMIPRSRRVNRGAMGMRALNSFLVDNGFETMLLIESRDRKPGELDFYQVLGLETVIKLPVSYKITHCELEKDRIATQEMDIGVVKTLTSKSINFSFRCLLGGLEVEWPPLLDLQVFLRRFFSINTVRRPRVRGKTIMNILIDRVTKGKAFESSNENSPLKCFAKWNFIDAGKGIEIGPVLQGYFILSSSMPATDKEKTLVEKRNIAYTG